MRASGDGTLLPSLGLRCAVHSFNKTPREPDRALGGEHGGRSPEPRGSRSGRAETHTNASAPTRVSKNPPPWELSWQGRPVGASFLISSSSFF